MRLAKFLCFFAFALLFLLLPSIASAQSSFKCESNDGHRNYCGNYDYNQVRFDRQISGSPCIEGQTWGVDSSGLWVDRGCRAYFTVRSGGYGDGPGYGGGSQESVKCESNDGRRNYCGSYDYRQVRMDRQISGSPCIEGQTWGVDRSGLWVDRGCRAYFTIRTGGYGGGPGYGGGNQSSVKCESNDGRRNYCGSYDYRQVRMDRQISGSPCIEGQTWGVDSSGLWVDRGCRAYFTVRTGGYGGGYLPGRPDDDDGWWNPDPDDTWPPRADWHGGNWNRGGACFYKDRNFSSSFFCLRRGESRESLGSYGDDISSIRTFGGARVTVYDDRNFSGARENLSGDISDLRQVGVVQKPGHTWNNRISSVRVQ